MKLFVKNHWPSMGLVLVGLIALMIWGRNEDGLQGGLSAVDADPYNQFDVSNAAIPEEEIFRGGPPRDGIPSIDDPKFVAASAADWMREEDLVISLTHNGETRAYPLRILVWHEVVNDAIGDRDLAITYCPLCGTAMVFDREVGDQTLEFGVSGLLFNSDVLLYDRQTESLWSQLAMEAVSGPMVGRSLDWVPSDHLTWQAWKAQNPDGRVLSTETGYPRDYSRSAYVGYEREEAVPFPFRQNRDELRNKEWVAGVHLNGEAKAYRIEALEEAETLTDTVGGVNIALRYDPEARHLVVQGRKDGESIPYVKAYWFAWQAFYPETELWAPDGSTE